MTIAKGKSEIRVPLDPETKAYLEAHYGDIHRDALDVRWLLAWIADRFTEVQKILGTTQPATDMMRFTNVRANSRQHIEHLLLSSHIGGMPIPTHTVDDPRDVGCRLYKQYLKEHWTRYYPEWTSLPRSLEIVLHPLRIQPILSALAGYRDDDARHSFLEGAKQAHAEIVAYHEGMRVATHSYHLVPFHDFIDGQVQPIESCDGGARTCLLKQARSMMGSHSAKAE